MLPTINSLLSSDIEIQTQPSKNYAMNLSKDTISGYNDELTAMSQVIYKILNTKRYGSDIYSKSYGVEFDDLFGLSQSLAVAELETRISEALLQDDRITDVSDFVFDTSKRNVVHATFTVATSFGKLESEIEVNI